MLSLALTSCLAVHAENKNQNTDKPNVIFIYADDLGYGDLECYGAKNVQTPNVNRLASEGIRFINAHATAATSTPSRYSMLTGEYAWRKPGTDVAAGNAGMIIRPEQYTMADMFKSSGYATGAFGKWHLGLGDKTAQQDWNAPLSASLGDLGFDYSYIMAATADRVPCVFIENGQVANYDPSAPIEVSYIKNFPGEPTGKDNPELLRMHPSVGHAGSIVNGVPRIGFQKGGKAAQWKDEDMAELFLEKAKGFLKDNKDKPFFLYYGLHQPHVPRVPNQKFVGKSGMGPRGDVILEADWCVTEFLKELDKLGLTENTLIILTSDNGPVLDDGYQDQAVEMVGNHKMAGPHRGGKTSLYDGGTCIPFLLRWPAVVKPGVSDALVCQMDLLASLAALTGQTYSDKTDSQNTLPVFLGKSDQGRKELVTEGYFNYALHQGDWVMIPPYPSYYDDPDGTGFSGLGNCYQLYNVKEDVGQNHNLADKEPKRLRQMMMTFEKLKRETGKITNY